MRRLAYLLLLCLPLLGCPDDDDEVPDAFGRDDDDFADDDDASDDDDSADDDDDDLVEGCDNDAYEPNEAQSSATSISDDQFNLVLCPDEEDWFAITLAAGEELEVYADFDPAEGSIVLRMVDGAGTTVDESTGAEPVITETIGNDGELFVQLVLGGDIGEVPGVVYDLVVTVNDALCPVDLFEPNEAPGAGPITSGSYPGLSACPKGEDWFELSVEMGDGLLIDVSFSQAEGDIDLFLYDPGDTLVASAESTTDDEQIDYEADATTPYHLLVQLTSDEGTSPGVAYGLEFSVTPAPSVCASDSFEPNDAFGSGPFVAAGSYGSLQACDADDDWFRVDLSAEESLDVQILFDHAEGDVNLMLYDSGMGLLTESLSVTDDEDVGYTLLVDDTLWIQVVLESDTGSIPGNEYELVVTVD
jgi:hypothetical protein